MSNKILDNPHISKLQKKRLQKRRFILGVFTAIIALMLFYAFIVHSGYFLVKDDSFSHISWVIVLDGQEADLERTEFAANLLRNGLADSVMVLGRRVFRDKYNCDFYVQDMLRSNDLDSGRIFTLGHNDPSTLEEAKTVIPWLKAKDADTVLLITQAAATARVSYIFNKLSGTKPYFKTIDIHHFSYNPATWASHRESRKWWLREMAANVAARFDLLFQDTLKADSSKLNVYISIQEESLQKEPELSPMSIQQKEPVKELSNE